jgi:hypothetical protein
MTPGDRRSLRGQTSLGIVSTQKEVQVKKEVSKIALVACVLAGCSAQTLAAQEVPVGRVDVRLPGDGWEVHLMDVQKNTISGYGHTHQQATEYKVLVRRGPDQLLDAVLMVRANASGIGRFNGVFFSGATCGGSAGVYAEGDEPGPAARSFRCLQVTAPRRSSALTDFPEDIASVLSKLGVRLPPSMFVVSAQQYSTTGAFGVVLAYLRPLASATATDKAQGIPDTLPQGVTATSVQWGRQLQEAVKDSVYSIGGKLPVPELKFVGETREPATLPAVPSPSPEPARETTPPHSNQG